MANETRTLREQPRLREAHRRTLRTFDHDCEGGHGPDCVPVSERTSYWLDDEEVTDPDTIARIDAQIAEG